MAEVEKRSYEIARDNLRALMAAHNIRIDALFVPWSKSRNFTKDNARTADRSLNWRVTVLVDKRPILSTDYSAGIAHCPSYGAYRFESVDKAEAIRRECETGKRQTDASGNLLHYVSGKAIEPDSVDVFGALLKDADAIEYACFEDWAQSLDYSTDSREAERIYRMCLEHGLALRAALGDTLLREAQNYAQEL